MSGMKKLLLIGLSVIMVVTVGLAGCGTGQEGGTETAEGKYGGTMRIGYIADVNVLNPISDISAVDRMVNGWLHDSLVVVAPDGTLEPRLAEKWTMSDDNKTIEFKLRPNAKWHDGEPFTADDVAFTVYTLLNPELRTNARGHFSALVGFEELTNIDNPASPEELPQAPVEVVDDYTVRFHLAFPYAPFLPLALTYGLVPEHLLKDDIAAGKDIAEAQYNLHPIGLGPFKFVEWRRDERLVFERFDDYYSGKPYLERLVFEIIPDRTVATSELESGGIDFLWQAMPNSWDHLKSQPDIAYHISSGLGYSGVVLNNEFPLFADKCLRQALRHALDMKTIVNEFLWQGMGAGTGPVPPTVWVHDPSIKPYAFDPDKAKTLLGEAGWTLNGGVMTKDDQPFAFTIETFDFAKERQQASIAAQEYWSQLGLEVETRWTETTVLLDRTNRGDFEAAWVNYTGYIDPDGTLTRFSCDRIDGGNVPRYCNPALDELLEAARRSADRDERTELYRAALQILHVDQPVLWAGYQPIDYWYNDKFKGFVNTPEHTGLFKNMHLVYIDD